MYVLQRVTNFLSDVAGAVAMTILVLMLGHILLEIVLRFFGRSTFVLDEIVGYGVASMTYLALASAFHNGSLIRVNLLLIRFEPNSLARRLIEVFCVVATMVVTSLAIWFFWNTVNSNYVRGFSSGTLADIPMWIPQGLLLIGLVLFWLQLLTYLLQVALGRADLEAGHRRGTEL